MCQEAKYFSRYSQRLKKGIEFLILNVKYYEGADHALPKILHTSKTVC